MKKIVFLDSIDLICEKFNVLIQLVSLSEIDFLGSTNLLRKKFKILGFTESRKDFFTEEISWI